MAFVPLIPAALSPTITKGLAQQYQSAPIVGFTGTAIDLSAWVTLTAKAVPASQSPVGTDVTFGTVTATNAGVVKLTVAASDLSTVETGTAKLLVYGKPTSGDDYQLLASGALTLNPS